MSKEVPPGSDKGTELTKRYPVGFTRAPKVEGNPSSSPESNWHGFETHQILNSNNEHFYNRMSDAGKGIARSMYETGYRTPGISRVMAGIEIGYNNSWMRRHERKASKWKDKMDAKDTTINVLEKQRANLEKQAANLREHGMPGSASLQVAMQKIERQKAKLLNKKGKYQTRFEKREDKIKSRISKRDIVADRMIGKYETKLRPIEKQIENLKIDQEHFNLEESALKVRHKAESARLDKLAKDRAELVEALGGGWRARHNAAVKAYDRMLADGQRTLDQEKDAFSRRKAKLDDYVAKLDQAADPYRKKRDKFVRAKEDRSVDFHAAISKKESPAESGPKPPESKESEKLIGLHVADWNEFLKKSGEKISPKLIDIILDEFLSAVRMRADAKLEKKDFTDLLENFYAYYYRKSSGEFSRENFKKIAADFINPKKEEPEKKKEEKKEAKDKKDKAKAESAEKPQGEIGLGKEAFDSIRKKLVNDKEFLERTIERIKKEPLVAGKTEEDRKKRIESHEKRLKTLNTLIEMMDKAAEESRKKTEAIEDEDDDDEEEEEETSLGDGKDGGDKDKK